MATTVLPRVACASRRSIRSSWVVGVDAGHRLVEEEQVRLRGERAGQEDAAPLAARQPSDLRPEVGRHADLVERVDRPRGGRPRPGRRIGPSRGKRPIITTSSTVTGNAPVDELRLRHVGDAARLAARRRAEDLAPARSTAASSPAMSLSSVLLPAPLGPTTASRLPGSTASVTCSSAMRSAVARRDVAQPDVRVGVRVGGVERVAVLGCVIRVERSGGGLAGRAAPCETQYHVSRTGRSRAPGRTAPRAAIRHRGHDRPAAPARAVPEGP